MTYTPRCSCVIELTVPFAARQSSLSQGSLRMIDHEEEHEIADEVYVFTHKKLSIAYNADRVIEVNLTSERPVKLDEGV